MSTLPDRDTTERLSPDDMANVRNEQFLQAALLTQRAAAARAAKGVPGVCTNCRAACLPHAVYCDDDCKADHQHREAVARKQGRAT